MQRLMKRCCQQFCALLGSRRYGYSLRSDTSRQRRDPHSLSATYFRRATASMSADLPSGKVPTTLVSRLLQRSMIAAAKRMPRASALFSENYVTWPEVVVKPRS